MVSQVPDNNSEKASSPRKYVEVAIAVVFDQGTRGC